MARPPRHRRALGDVSSLVEIRVDAPDTTSGRDALRRHRPFFVALDVAHGEPFLLVNDRQQPAVAALAAREPSASLGTRSTSRRREPNSAATRVAGRDNRSAPTPRQRRAASELSIMRVATRVAASVGPAIQGFRCSTPEAGSADATSRRRRRLSASVAWAGTKAALRVFPASGSASRLA